MQQCLGAALLVLTLTVWPMLEDRNIVYRVLTRTLIYTLIVNIVELFLPNRNAVWNMVSEFYKNDGIEPLLCFIFSC